MRKVIILRGLPGSGKSTHIKKMVGGLEVEGYRWRVVSADHYFEVNGEYRFDASRLGEAHSRCFSKFMTSMLSEVCAVIVDNTNTSAWEISPYVLAATTYGYLPEIVEIDCDPEVAASRNIHGVPRETVLKMAERMKEPLPPFWKRKVISQDQMV